MAYSQEETQPEAQYVAVYKVYHPHFEQLELYGGQYPGPWDKKDDFYMIEELMDLGITTSICLMQTKELQRFLPYKERALEINQAFKWLHYPIVDMSVPSKAVMKQILDDIDKLIAADEKIYVHCLGGHGRTAAVIGCWLKRHGFKQLKIYQKLAQWRIQTLFGQTSSPQDGTQFAMINKWQPGE